MPVDKITVRLDAAQIIPMPTTPTIRQDITIRDTQARAFKEGVWIEPFSQILMVKPLQMAENAYTDTEIIRHPAAAWFVSGTAGTAITDHWDNVYRDQEVWIAGDGTAQTIETLAKFPTNAGFLFKVWPYGTSDDLFDAFEVFFGQWRLTVRSDGLASLYENTEDFSRVSGVLSTGAQDKLTGHISELLILPTASDTLFIRRNGVAGFTYKLPATEGVSGAVIEAGSFKVKTFNGCAMRCELTQLRWPTALTGYHFVTPNMVFAKAPVEGQSVAVELVSDIPGISGGVVASICNPWSDGDTWADINGSPFVADGSAVDYCVAVSLIGDSAYNSTPMVMGLRLTADPLDPSAPSDPTDITADVRSLSIQTGDSVFDTQACIVIRDPEDHPIYGACNRRVTITAGSTTIFDGVLKEPSRYAYTEQGDNYYECTAMSLAKGLEEQCLPNSFFFDGVDHTEAVRVLCYHAGMVDANLDFQEDDTPLPDTRRIGPNGEMDSELRPGNADKPLDWIEQIIEKTGWEFTDGYSEGGNFVFKYRDPYALSTTVAHTFYMKTADCTEDYQKVYSWYPDSLEPEANEVYVIGRDREGKKIAGRWWHQPSQDASLTEEERPDNWLGIRRMATIEVGYEVNQDWVQQAALRFGREVGGRRDVVTFEADYPLGLWKGDVVEVIDSSAVKQERVGKLRILTIDNIAFENEALDVPDRRATYQAVWIGVNG